MRLSSKICSENPSTACSTKRTDCIRTSPVHYLRRCQCISESISNNNNSNKDTAHRKHRPRKTIHFLRLASQSDKSEFTKEYHTKFRTFMYPINYLRRSLITVLLLHQLTINQVRTISVSLIRNVSLTIPGANTTIINGTCKDCICALLLNTTFFAVNCLVDNQRCELYSKADQNRSFSLIPGVSASFYFMSFPTFVAIESTSLSK